MALLVAVMVRVEGEEVGDKERGGGAAKVSSRGNGDAQCWGRGWRWWRRPRRLVVKQVGKQAKGKY